MYGRNVLVNFKGKNYFVFVFCEQSTPDETLQRKGLDQLQKLYDKYGKSHFEWALSRTNQMYR